MARFALRLALGDLRGGFRGLPVLLACIVLGTAGVAGVGSLSASLSEGLGADARATLGGEAEVRVTHRPADAAETAAFAEGGGRVSLAATLRGMAHDSAGHATLVEIKAVDAAYPLFGAVGLDPPLPLADALAGRGILVERALARRLGLRPGDVLEIGDASLEVRAVLEHEPDRLASMFELGPRVIMSLATLEATGIVRPGSLVRYGYRVDLPPGADAAGFRDRLAERFPAADWQVRDYRSAGERTARFIRRLELHLTLVGLAALLVGGIGIGGAVRGHVESRLPTIAILKCLGAPRRLVLGAWILQALLLALAGTAAGAALGALAPVLAGPLLSEHLRAPLPPGPHALPLARAAAFGLLTAAAFALAPVARAADASPAGLFRVRVAPSGRRLRPGAALGTAAAFALIAGLALWGSPHPVVVLGFAGAAALTALAFRGLARALDAGLRRLPRVRWPALAQAVGGLTREGAPTAARLLAVGVGLSILVATALIESNLAASLDRDRSADTPTHFLIDIQPGQMAPLRAALGGIEGLEVADTAPMIRGRIVAVDGVPADRRAVDPEVEWMARRDVGFSVAARPPREGELVAGAWWPEDYEGPALVSFTEEGAAGMGLEVGDPMTFRILGRTVEARIANLRRVEWESFRMNFVAILNPGALAGAPRTHIATIRARGDAGDALYRVLADGYPNVSALAVDAIAANLERLIGAIAAAVRTTGLGTLAVGVLVLAGVALADHRRRVAEWIVLKVLGATRRNARNAFLVENAILGGAAAILATVAGSLGAWAFVAEVMQMPFRLDGRALAGTVLLAAAAMAGVGWWAMRRMLGEPAARHLRNE